MWKTSEYTEATGNGDFMRINVGLALLLTFVGCKNEQGIIGETPVVGIGDAPPPVNPVQEDRIVQVTRPSVDVLFVIDNSCSMLEEQQNLAENFPLFMNYFLTSGLDYHIGVVSTDLEDPSHSGKLQLANGFAYIDENTPNPEEIFASMVSMGTGGWFEERGRDAVYSALDLRADDPNNAGFMREGAELDVIFVSDEDDNSLLISEAEFIEWMAALKWAPGLATSHAIVGPDNGGTTCPDAGEPGVSYLNYAEVTEGVVFSICSEDWGPVLDQLGLETSGLRREYFLTKIPVVETLDVSVILPTDSGDVTVQFSVCSAGDEIDDPTCEVVYNAARNSIVFLDYLPDPQSVISAVYFIQENYAAGAEIDPLD